MKTKGALLSKRLLAFSLCCLFCLSCSKPVETEKYQKSRDKVVDVHDKVVEINTGDVLIGNNSRMHLLGDCWIVIEYGWSVVDDYVHLFDRNTYKPLLSTGRKGQGPGEITNPGLLMMDEVHNCFYLPDNGRMKMYTYKVEELLKNPDYQPELKCSFADSRVPNSCLYVCDTLSIGDILIPIGTNDFRTAVGCWNMLTGEVRLMPYEHPEIKKKRASTLVSLEHGLYVDVYSRDDLLTICDLDGHLKYNIYGPNWNHGKWNDKYQHIASVICGDRIVTAYSGRDRREKDSFLATQLQVFDLEGNYLKTLEVGYGVKDLCYDGKNNRLLLSMNDDIQFGYLPLEGLF